MATNDPHVVALEYRIEHGPDIDWSRAAPLDKEEDRFRVQVGNGRVRFELDGHHASARKAVGRTAPHSPEEERFLKSAVRTVIRRAAEVAYGPDPSRRQIALNDI